MTQELQKATELKLCPFCGGEAEIERMGSRRSSMIVCCTYCGCRMESSDTDIKHCAWNTRHHEPQQAVDEEVIRKALAKQFSIPHQTVRESLIESFMRAILPYLRTEQPKVDELKGAAAEAAIWVEASLSCKDWRWDADQRQAAEFALNRLVSAIAALSVDKVA